MRIKVLGGTPRHSDSSLCATCARSTIIQGETLDERIVECHASVMQGRLIPFRVTSCTAYNDARLPSYMEMVKTAWILEPHRTKRRPAGFFRGEDLTPLELADMAAHDPDEPY